MKASQKKATWPNKVYELRMSYLEGCRRHDSFLSFGFSANVAVTSCAMAEYVVVNAELPETSQHDGDGMDISANGSMQQLDCTSPSASSTVPADDMREMLTAVAQHSDLAAALRQKGQAGRAVRTLERAVAMCARAEHIHPAVAVEAARARVNLAAALSEARS